MPREVNLDAEGEFKPVVRVREGGKGISPAQKDRFEKLISEGKRLFLEEMDYEGALRKFKEAENLAVTRSQKADVCFYLSLAYYAFQEEESTEKSIEMMRKLIEIDYYRELDKLLCPPKYLDLFLETKAEYGALRIQSKPSGADVYLDAKRVPEGKTPLTIGYKAGSVDVRVKKGSKEKKDTLTVYAGGETTSPVYKLGGGSSALLILGGVVLAGGVGLALALGKKGDGGGTSEPTTGSIQVNSTPTGASVYLDGSNTGRTTNCTLTNVSQGSHSLKLELELYGKWEGNAQVTVGQTTQINATLAPFKYEFVTKWGSHVVESCKPLMPHDIASVPVRNFPSSIQCLPT